MRLAGDARRDAETFKIYPVNISVMGKENRKLYLGPL